MLWSKRTTTKRNTGMTPAKLMCGEEYVLPIELKMASWQTLPWSSVRTTWELIEMRARQIDTRRAELQEAAARQYRMRDEANDY